MLVNLLLLQLASSAALSIGAMRPTNAVSRAAAPQMGVGLIYSTTTGKHRLMHTNARISAHVQVSESGGVWAGCWRAPEGGIRGAIHVLVRIAPLTPLAPASQATPRPLRATSLTRLVWRLWTLATSAATTSRATTVSSLARPRGTPAPTPSARAPPGMTSSTATSRASTSRARRYRSPPRRPPPRRPHAEAHAAARFARPFIHPSHPSACLPFFSGRDLRPRRLRWLQRQLLRRDG